MIKKMLAAASAALVLLLAAGCASIKPMPFKDASERLADKKNPIYLMTVTLENQLRKAFQPTLQAIDLMKKAGPDKWERVGFSIDMEGRFLNEPVPSGEGYAVRMELEPGEYEIRLLYASSYAVLTNSIFEVPMASPLVVREGRGVFYLGNVRATMRARKPGDLVAGPSLPILGQEMAGVPGGSFDVVISDRQAADEAIFRSKFPALASTPIRKAILPPPDPARVLKAHPDAQVK